VFFSNFFCVVESLVHRTFERRACKPRKQRVDVAITTRCTCVVAKTLKKPSVTALVCTHGNNAERTVDANKPHRASTTKQNNMQKMRLP
jgi:hypothetical protein